MPYPSVLDSKRPALLIFDRNSHMYSTHQYLAIYTLFPPLRGPKPSQVERHSSPSIADPSPQARFDTRSPSGDRLIRNHEIFSVLCA